MKQSTKMSYWEAPMFLYSNHDKAANIIRIISEKTGVSQNLIKSSDRRPKIAEPRQLCCYFIRKYTTLTLKAIGERLEGRDHSTVFHAVSHIEDLIITDKRIRTLVTVLDVLFENYEYTFTAPLINKG